MFMIHAATLVGVLNFQSNMLAVHIISEVFTPDGTAVELPPG